MDSLFTKANFAPSKTSLSGLSLQSVEGDRFLQDETQFHICSVSEYLQSPYIASQEYNM